MLLHLLRVYELALKFCKNFSFHLSEKNNVIVHPIWNILEDNYLKKRKGTFDISVAGVFSCLSKNRESSSFFETISALKTTILHCFSKMISFTVLIQPAKTVKFGQKAKQK